MPRDAYGRKLGRGSETRTEHREVGSYTIDNAINGVQRRDVYEAQKIPHTANLLFYPTGVGPTDLPRHLVIRGDIVVDGDAAADLVVREALMLSLIHI